MRIIFCFSLEHFNPNLSESKHLYWGSSSNILARSLFKILSELGELVYTDLRGIEKYKHEKFDLAIGTINGFKKLTQTVDARINVIFNAQMHPIERNLIFLKFINENKLARYNLFDFRSISSMFSEIAGIKKANFLLGVGNFVTQNSFIKYGVDRNKIKFINYGILNKDVNINTIIKRYPIIDFIYFATEVGMRKGFDLLFEIFSNLSIGKYDFKLHIVGALNHPVYIEKMDTLKCKLNDKIIFHGWINSDTDEYEEILANTDVLLFPSLEEGQAGTVIDSIRQGVIPLLSRNTGVDFSPLGFFDSNVDSKSNINLVKSIFSKSEAELVILKQQSIRFYQEFHSEFYNNLKQNINFVLTGSLYPKFVIIIPISNVNLDSKFYWVSLHKMNVFYPNLEFHFLFMPSENCLLNRVKKKFEGDSKIKYFFHKAISKFDVKAINKIIKESDCFYSLITQDNLILRHSLFYETAVFFEKNPKISILGLTKTTSIRPDRVFYSLFDKNFGKEKRIFRVDSFWGKSVIYRKSFLEKIGFLNESLNTDSEVYNDTCMRAVIQEDLVYVKADEIGRCADYNVETGNFCNSLDYNVNNLFSSDYLEIIYYNDLRNYPKWYLFKFISLLCVPFLYAVLNKFRKGNFL